MDKNEFNILFLDDEIFNPDEPAFMAAQSLEELGYAVHRTDHMSEVLSLSRRHYFHLYLLDIDMGKVQDEFDGNGATVGEVLRRLSSLRNVIVYSARGTVKDWFTAANYHFYAYVHKDKRGGGGEEQLISVVNKLFESQEQISHSIPAPSVRSHSNAVLLYRESCQISLDFIKSKLDKDLVVVDSLDLIPDKCREHDPCLVVILIPSPPKDLRGRKFFKDHITAAFSVQPTPNVIVCTGAAKEDEKQILKIINASPFRMLDLNSPVFEKEFDKAVEEALLWYGENEIFNFPDQDQVPYVPMTAEDIAGLKPDEWEDLDDAEDMDND